jgi:D-lactate dehydrogenase (cytochrome)
VEKNVTMPDGMRAAPAAAIFEPLRALLGERFTTGEAVRHQHSHGEGLPTVGMPDAVAFPATDEEVAAIASLCSDALVPIVPFGSRTSLEGHVAAVHGGICVDFSNMARVVAVSPAALDCRVQAGVTQRQLNADLRSYELFYPVDPVGEASPGAPASAPSASGAPARASTASACTSVTCSTLSMDRPCR